MSEILTRKFSASSKYLYIIRDEEKNITIKIIISWQLDQQGNLTVAFDKTIFDKSIAWNIKD